MDLKENPRGYYLKISERGSSRERSTVVVPQDGVPYILELFRFYSAGGLEAGAATAKHLQLETKAFYFEVGENVRGRFLKVSEGNAGPRGRSMLIIPSGGPGDEAWGTFADKVDAINTTLTMLGPMPAPIADDNSNSLFANSFPAGNGVGQAPLRVAPQISATISNPVPATVTAGEDGSQIVRAGQKRFFFDVGRNQRGGFMRITEASAGGRTSLMVPAEAFTQFYEAMTKALEHANNNEGPES